MAQGFTLQTAEQFLNELADEKIEINVCNINLNSSPLKLIDVKNLKKVSSSPSDIQFATLVAQLAKGRFELPVSIKLFIDDDPDDTDILGLKYEALVYQFIMTNIIETKVSPNFVSFVAYGCCPDSKCYLMTEKVGSGVQFGKDEHFPVDTLSALYPIITLNSKYQILFQIVYSLEAMARLKMMHNDLHTINILVMRMNEPITLKYIVDNRTFVIKTKYIPYIYDWDLGFVEELGNNSKINDFYTNDINVDNSFNPIRDAYTLFCYLEYRQTFTTSVGSIYAKNPTMISKESGKTISIEKTVKEKVEHNFRPDRMVDNKKIYKLTLPEFEIYIGKNTAPTGVNEIYFFFVDSKTIAFWNPYECRLSSKSNDFFTPSKLLENQFDMFEVKVDVDTPFVYRLPANKGVEEVKENDKEVRDGKTFLKGLLHSFNGEPAVKDKNGKMEWYQNGLKHRDNDLPAVIQPNGRAEWWHQGEVHRDNDRPAVIRSDGGQLWYRNGLPHRDNGPAKINPDGTEEWWHNGIQDNKK